MNVSTTPQIGNAAVSNTGTAMASRKTDSPSDAVPFACELSQARHDQTGAPIMTVANSAKQASLQHEQSASKPKRATNGSTAAVQTPSSNGPNICFCVQSDLLSGNLALVPKSEVAATTPSQGSSPQESPALSITNGENSTPKSIAGQSAEAQPGASTTQPAAASGAAPASASEQSNAGTTPDSPDGATQAFRVDLAHAQASSAQAAMTVSNVTSTTIRESPGLATMKADNFTPTSTCGPSADAQTEAITSHAVPSSGLAQGSDGAQSNSGTPPTFLDNATQAFHFELLQAKASSVQAAMKISDPTDPSSGQSAPMTEAKAANEASGTGDVQNHAKLIDRLGDSGTSQATPEVSSPALSTATQSSGDWTPSQGDQGNHQGDPRSTGEQTAGKAHADAILESSPSTLALAASPSQAVKFSDQAQAPVSTPQSAPSSADGGGALDTWRSQTLHAGNVVTAAGLDGGFGGSEMHVQLRTEILGALDLRASLDGNRLAASIGVVNSDAHAILASELPTLHQALASQNLHLEQVSILNRGGVQEHAGGQRGGQSGSGSQPDRGTHSDRTVSQAASKLDSTAAPPLSGEPDETYWERTRLLSVRA